MVPVRIKPELTAAQVSEAVFMVGNGQLRIPRLDPGDTELAYASFGIADELRGHVDPSARRGRGRKLHLKVPVAGDLLEDAFRYEIVIALPYDDIRTWRQVYEHVLYVQSHIINSWTG